MQAEIDEKNSQLSLAKKALESDLNEVATLKTKTEELLRLTAEVMGQGQAKEAQDKADLMEQTTRCSSQQDEIAQLTIRARRLTSQMRTLVDDAASLREEVVLVETALQDDMSATLQESLKDQEGRITELQAELDRVRGESEDTQREDAEMMKIKAMGQDSQGERLRLLNEREMLVSKLNEVKAFTKVRDGFIATLKAQSAVYTVPTQAELSALPNDIETLKRIFARTEEEFKELGGSEVVDHIWLMKKELQKQIKLNGQISQRVGQVREAKFSQSLRTLPQAKKTQEENCSLQ
jgi:hypothetical protein